MCRVWFIILKKMSRSFSSIMITRTSLFPYDKIISSVLIITFIIVLISLDVYASSDAGPTETECRPYIEKAINELKTGEEKGNLI